MHYNYLHTFVHYRLALAQSAHLWVILSDHDVKKTHITIWNSADHRRAPFTCSSWIWSSWNFCLHDKDADFGDEFLSLVSTTDFVAKATIKVVYIGPPSTQLWP